jgi:hypothetical protein
MNPATVKMVVLDSSDLWSKLAMFEKWQETLCSSLLLVVNRTRFSGTRCGL